MTVDRGKFITIEGIEGVGKSSNIDILVQHLQQSGIDVLTTREPGGTPLAEEIRELLVNRNDEAIPEIAELLLMFAARALNVENVIKPALAAGTWVICDRFTDSSRAYQGGGRGIPMQIIDGLADSVHGDTWPDLTILLDAPVDVGLQRAKSRSKPDRFEEEQHTFFAKVRNCYLSLAEAEPERFAVIDTTQSLPKVNQEVINLADRLMVINNMMINR